ncbi:hypothetical protein MP228_004345 [Amoeboaphelidium protococcarum]|nr:hypothetical protein MP228_004345 [Amoeboaphelidium protococcarum]
MQQEVVGEPARKRQKRRGKRAGRSGKLDVDQDQQQQQMDDIHQLPQKQQLQQQDVFEQYRYRAEFQGRLSPEMVKYVESMLTILQGKFDTDNGDNGDGDHSLQDNDETRLLIESLYDEIDGKELMVATDYSGSRLMELMVRMSSEFQLRVLMDRMRGHYLDMLCDRMASHVIQVILFKCHELLMIHMNYTNDSAIAADSKDVNDDQEELMSLQLQLNALVEEVHESLMYCIVNQNANQVLKILILLLVSGYDKNTVSVEQYQQFVNQAVPNKDARMKLIEIKQSVINAQFSSEQQVAELKSFYRDCLVFLMDKVKSSSLLTAKTVYLMGTNKATVSTIVLLIGMLKVIDGEDGVLKLLELVIIKSRMFKSNFASMAKDSSASRFVEFIFECLSPYHGQDEESTDEGEQTLDQKKAVLLKDLWTSCLKDDLRDYCAHPIGNFVVKSFFSAIYGSTELSEMVLQSVVQDSELLKSLVQDRKTKSQLLISICNLASTFQVSNDFNNAQRCIVDAIKDGYQKGQSKKNQAVASKSLQLIDFIGDKNLSGDSNQYAYANQYREISAGGCALLSSLFQFDFALIKWTVTMMFQCAPADLVLVVQNPHGSRMLQAFVESPQIPDRTKVMLYKHLISGASPDRSTPTTNNNSNTSGLFNANRQKLLRQKYAMHFVNLFNDKGELRMKK